MVVYKNGDIFTSHADVIAHQVNCQGASGRGIAGQIDKLFPEATHLYKRYTKELIKRYGNETARILGEICVYSNSKPVIAHLYAQNFYGYGICHTNYGALKLAMERLCTWINDHKILFNKDNIFLAFPYGIGCGNAGGDWNIVNKIIHEVYHKCSFEVQIWKLGIKEQEIKYI